MTAAGLSAAGPSARRAARPRRRRGDRRRGHRRCRRRTAPRRPRPRSAERRACSSFMRHATTTRSMPARSRTRSHRIEPAARATPDRVGLARRRARREERRAHLLDQARSTSSPSASGEQRSARLVAHSRAPARRRCLDVGRVGDDGVPLAGPTRGRRGRTSTSSPSRSPLARATSSASAHTSLASPAGPAARPRARARSRPSQCPRRARGRPRAAQRRLDDVLGLGPRHQHAPVDLEVEVPEALRPMM